MKAVSVLPWRRAIEGQRFSRENPVFCPSRFHATALQAKEREVKQELEKKAKELLRQLRDEAHAELLEVLTPTQRAKLKEMVGEKFEWE